MKRLVLIRHGKSSWDFPELSDQERPLKKRGRNDGAIIGEQLKSKNILPDLMISSPANRAHSTAKLIAHALSYPLEKIRVNDHLYFSGTSTILNMVSETDDANQTVFIFGHNPDFTSFANVFSKQSIYNVPTTGVVGIDFDVERWSQINSDNGQVFIFDFPSNYK